ncbi:response regulator transcription factor [Aeromicrobium fastidiosum]|uniref:response regulator transcription factor n=1 Tax=Aeromicrobium fastidiosum TaxID=52699 RepID=UPI0027DEFD48|nr:response regulator transcription factor [Aeromicrobium fastidiosum]
MADVTGAGAGPGTDAPIRVLLADDDALVRAGLAMILGGSSTIDVVGEASDGQEAVRRVRAGGIDLVLMDIRMPVMDGIAATAALVALPDAPKVIVLTTFDADEYVVRALAAGANGFLLKDTPPADIVDAVARVVAGEPMLSPAITEQLIRQVTDAVPDVRAGQALERVACLTDREREVAVAIGRGASNAEIAVSLHMSVATVKAHISHLFTKLGATNRVQVAIAMHEAGLL